MQKHDLPQFKFFNERESFSLTISNVSTLEFESSKNKIYNNAILSKPLGLHWSIII